MLFRSVPSHLPNELLTGESRYTKAQRARWFLDRIGIVSTPLQLLDITQMQEKMLWMFLFQKGAQLPQSAYMEKFGVTGYDALHQEWKEEQVKEAIWKLETQVAVAGKAKELGVQPQEEGGKGQGKGGGRPNTNEKPPKASMKGSQSGNVRVTNKTS